jgi:hypothetical protein
MEILPVCALCQKEMELYSNAKKCSCPETPKYVHPNCAEKILSNPSRNWPCAICKADNIPNFSVLEESASKLNSLSASQAIEFISVLLVKFGKVLMDNQNEIASLNQKLSSTRNKKKPIPELRNEQPTLMIQAGNANDHKFRQLMTLYSLKFHFGNSKYFSTCQNMMV